MCNPNKNLYFQPKHETKLSANQNEKIEKKRKQKSYKKKEKKCPSTVKRLRGITSCLRFA